MADGFFVATAPFETVSYGRFEIMVSDADVTEGEHVVLVKQEVGGYENVLCRVASKCMTSAVFDAADCDCLAQNRYAMSIIRTTGKGVLIYLDQEGRGHGLATKVRAMNGKAAGLDTYKAVEQLGLEPDVRRYDDVPGILSALGIGSIALLTSNPDKSAYLQRIGVQVTQIIPCKPTDCPPGAERHLRAKRRRGHAL
jgi:GTP cyclohydrolase II